METSLHQQLKMHYATDPAQTEVVLDGFRIDAISDSGELIEIQHASLGALRDKTRKLLSGTAHELRIVKPIVARKRLTTLEKKGGEVIRSRMSPKRCDLNELFMDLVHFATVFPMERLTLEAVLIEAEEIRIDRKRPTRRGVRHKLLDQRLTDVLSSIELRTLDDLRAMLPLASLPSVFDTAELASAMELPRWFAQKVAYCLRKTGAADLAGKRGNAQLYSLPKKAKPTRVSKKRRRKSVAA